MKEGGIEGREGILGGSPALSIERITALCSREIHPPVRAGQPLPGPGGRTLPIHLPILSPKRESGLEDFAR
ncbi:MAG: hypothetical protein Q7W38_05245 [Deltaproteobacteria bacterium]|nr:hypothetical protein [Deltaproteobacteria bacterium]